MNCLHPASYHERRRGRYGGANDTTEALSCPETLSVLACHLLLAPDGVPGQKPSARAAFSDRVRRTPAAGFGQSSSPTAVIKTERAVCSGLGLEALRKVVLDWRNGGAGSWWRSPTSAQSGLLHCTKQQVKPNKLLNCWVGLIWEGQHGSERRSFEKTEHI